LKLNLTSLFSHLPIPTYTTPAAVDDPKMCCSRPSGAAATVFKYA